MTKTDKERVKELENKFEGNKSKMIKILEEYKKLELENKQIKAELDKSQDELTNLKKENAQKATELDQALTGAEKKADEFEAQILMIEQYLKIK